ECVLGRAGRRTSGSRSDEPVPDDRIYGRARRVERRHRGVGGTALRTVRASGGRSDRPGLLRANGARTMTRALRIVWLAVIWVALWSDFSVANVLTGLLVAGVIVALFDTWHRGQVIVRPIAAAKFGAFFLYQ